MVNTFSNAHVAAGTTATYTSVGAYAPSLACFAAGTRIAGARGPLAVEDVTAGDQVETASGDVRTVRWVGKRVVDVARHPNPGEVAPVRVRAGAFAPSVPVRDLLLSPDHAVFAEGVLVPVRHLVNGTSVVAERLASIAYFHIELESHDVLLAEALPCESYLERGNRNVFANATPAMPSAAGEAFAELVTHGPVLERIRAALAARADTLEAARLAA